MLLLHHNNLWRRQNESPSFLCVCSWELCKIALETSLLNEFAQISLASPSSVGPVFHMVMFFLLELNSRGPCELYQHISLDIPCECHSPCFICVRGRLFSRWTNEAPAAQVMLVNHVYCSPCTRLPDSLVTFHVKYICTSVILKVSIDSPWSELFAEREKINCNRQ